MKYIDQVSYVYFIAYASEQIESYNTLEQVSSKILKWMAQTDIFCKIKRLTLREKTPKIDTESWKTKKCKGS